MSAGPTTRQGTVILAALALCAACDTAPAGAPPEDAQAPSPIAASAAVLTEPTSFFYGRPLDLPSPNRRYRLVSSPAADGLTQLSVIRTSDGERQVVGWYEPPTAVLWSPSSQSFFINDQRGSGQSSYLEVVRLEQGRFRVDGTARRNLNQLYNRVFECDLSEDFINSRGDSWLDGSTIVVELQASHHSGGCALDPFATNQLVLLVDAGTGEVLRRRSVRR